jgi:hypothetical protein
MLWSTWTFTNSNSSFLVLHHIHFTKVIILKTYSYPRKIDRALADCLPTPKWFCQDSKSRQSWNLGIKNCSRYTGIEKSFTGSVKISQFRMKKFEINEPVQYKTFFRWSVFKMSHFDIMKAKKSHLRIIKHQKNFITVLFNKFKYHFLLINIWNLSKQP